MPIKADTKKNQVQKSKVSVDFRKNDDIESSLAPVLDLPWETDLLKVYGKEVSLSHPPLESGGVTMEYGLSPSIIPIQEGVTIKPGRAFGQVAAYDDKITGQTSIIFNAAGGEVDFAPPNLKGVKAKGELAVANLVAERSPEAAVSDTEKPVIDSITLPPLYSDGLEMLSPADEQKTEQNMSAPVQTEALSEKQTPDTSDTTEISIALAEPMVIEPIDDFQIELGSAEYIKHKNESEPRLKFHRTKLTYKNRSVSQEFEAESDRSGLHPKDELRVPLDVDTLAESGFEKAQGQNMAADLLLDSDGAAIDTFSRDDLVSVTELLQEEAVKHEESPDSRESLPPEREITHSKEKAASDNAVVRIGNASFYLYSTKSENGNIVSAEQCECYHNSFDIKLQGIRLNGHGELSGSVKSIALLTNPDVKILCENLICDEVNGMHTDSALLKRGEKQYALEDVTLEETERISANKVRAEIDGYSTTLHNAAIWSYGSIDYDSAEVETVLHFGLNAKDKNSKYDDSAKAFFTFRLGKGSVVNDRFGSGTQALQLAGQQKHTEKQIGADQARSDHENTAAKDKRTAQKITDDIFTDDGFLQLEDARFDFSNDKDGSASVRGTGSFRFLKIPYDITVPGKKGVGSASHIKGDTQEKQEHENETDFTIDNGGKINAKLGNFVQLPMLKGKNESESVIKTLTLNDAAIKDSVLTAESVRIDRGFNLQQDIEDNTESETAKRLFGMGLSGTIADVGGSARLSRDKGIIGETEKKQLGQFAVSDFLGFLDASGDYAAGTLHAGLHAGAEKSRDNT